MQQLQHEKGTIGEREGGCDPKRKHRHEGRKEDTGRMKGTARGSRRMGEGRDGGEGMKYIDTYEQSRVMVSLLKLKCS